MADVSNSRKNLFKPKSWWSRGLIIAILASFLVPLFADDAEARRKRRRRSAKRPKIINEKKLFERMGGRDSITGTVDEWIRLSLADAVLAVKLKDLASQPKDLAKSRKLLADEICEIADGPCTTEDSEWVKIRTRYKMDEVTTVAFASLLSEALLSRGVGERERNEVLGRLGSIEPLAVSEATGPASERRGGNR